ncbi:DUF647 domain-containing protein [Aspergillus sp. HF37]|nr:DUF647 domain-containing protein [Aspergillus sp. HF37]
MPITFTESDEVNNPTATYIYSESRSKDGHGRLDALEPHSASSREWFSAGIVKSLADIFLPAGYPHSVSDDYLPYQIFDSLQAFCSSIAGLLSSRAVLQGVGVGNATASPTTALLLHILQDSSGRLATILFAHRVGPALEPECKTFRLAADVFNDVAMVLDCVSPRVPAGTPRVGVLSAAGVLRALCGVAGGSSKASLSAHFARWGNIAEVNAKDSSQETIISLVGMLVGSYAVSRITGSAATWTALVVLLAAHLALNYAAVRAVQMTSLNRQRANIVFSALLDSDPDLDLDLARRRRSHRRILTPAETSKREKIFARDGALTWFSPSSSHGGIQLGHGLIGIDLPTFLQSPSTRSTTRTRTLKPSPNPNLGQLTTLFANEAYMLNLTHTGGGGWDGRIILKPGCSAEARLKAWCHALLAARVLSSSAADAGSVADAGPEKQDEGGGRVLGVISQTLDFLTGGDRFRQYCRGLREMGWDVEGAALETRAGRRVSWVDG